MQLHILNEAVILVSLSGSKLKKGKNQTLGSHQHTNQSSNDITATVWDPTLSLSGSKFRKGKHQTLGGHQHTNHQVMT